MNIEVIRMKNKIYIMFSMKIVLSTAYLLVFILVTFQTVPVSISLCPHVANLKVA